MQWAVAGTAAVFLHLVGVGVAEAEPAEQGASAGPGPLCPDATFSGSSFPPTACCRGWPASFWHLANLGAARSVSIATGVRKGGGGRRREALVGIPS